MTAGGESIETGHAEARYAQVVAMFAFVGPRG